MCIGLKINSSNGSSNQVYCDHRLPFEQLQCCGNVFLKHDLVEARWLEEISATSNFSLLS